MLTHVLLTALFAASLIAQNPTYQLHGINFSPFIDGQNPDHGSTVTESQVTQRLGFVAPYTQWIRTFGATGGLEHIPAVAKSKFQKSTAVGAWLGPDNTTDQKAANRREIDALVALAQAGRVDLAIVGSETLERGDLTAQQLTAFINDVRTRIRPFTNAPVTTADTYFRLISNQSVLDAVDVVFVNYYPFWSGYSALDAVGLVHRWHRDLKSRVPVKEVIVSETGWPSNGNPVGAAVPSPTNAATYFQQFVSWARANQVKYFYFAAFDEAWKTGKEGPQGQFWGVWDRNGVMKPGMEQVFNGATVARDWAAVDGAGTPSIHFTYVPALGSTTPNDVLEGRVAHVDPLLYKVAMYINVAGRWWVKPFSDNRRNIEIQPDGTFAARTDTGGNDASAGEIAIFLVPASFAIPATADSPTLDASLLALAANFQNRAFRSERAISGRVQDVESGPQPRPVSGVAMNVATAATSTSASGQYSFPFLTTVNHTVTPSSPVYFFTPADLTFSPLNGVVRNADFTARPAPGLPTNPSPFDGQGQVPLNPTLAWTTGIFTETYDVHFGTTANPPLVRQSGAQTSYAPGALVADTVYYWKVVARRGVLQTSSPLWSFRTQVNPTGTGLRFVPLEPCRVMETRAEYNFQNRTGPFGPPFMNGGETRTLALPQSNVCQIPSTAKAYVLNVTLVPRGPIDFVTVWPAGETRPEYWTVRSPDAQIVANSAIVKAGAAGAISVYASDNVDIIIDISGYFTDNPQVSNLVFYRLTPCRVIDTRIVYRPTVGAFGPPSLNARQTRRFRFPQTPYCSIPASARAFSVTITLVPPSAPVQFLTAWPAGASQPNISNINSPAGRILANSVILPASPDGSIDVYAFDNTDMIVDINGYFAPDDGQQGLYYYPVSQCRLSDSSSAAYWATFGGPIFSDETTRTIRVRHSPRCGGVPATAAAYALNVTALPQGSPMPFLTAFPTGEPQPEASILNAFQGQIVTNSAIVPAGADGAINMHAFRRTHVVVEISGYFAR